ncbi:MAG: T9SS type A sorting domain-containing protein [Flavobacteriia bacterium]|nr:T9SS type A sorting domain-containing protein [Flavobacteriia bacterium]
MKNLNCTNWMIILLFFANINQVKAAARTWIGAGAGGAGTDFNSASNWTGAGALLSTDDLTMNISGNATITVSANVTIRNLTFTVSGGNIGILSSGTKILTVNGPFVCNGVDYFNPANYSYARIYSASSGAGFIFNSTATFHNGGAGRTNLYAATTSPGFMKFYNNVTFGSNCFTSPGVEPEMYFDATISQTITCNNSLNYVMPEDLFFGFVNSPTITFAGSKQDWFYGTYDGNVRIKNSTLVKANYCTLDGYVAALNFYMESGSKLEINYTNDFPQGGYNGYSLDPNSTVEYLGAASNQTVSGTSVVSLAYGHLIIGGSGNKSTGSNTICKGNFTINNGATFLSNGFTHENRANFTNNGTFTAGTSTHQFTGSVMQFINGTNLPVFYKLTINNTSTGVTLNRQANVSNLLTLTDGVVYTSAGNHLEVTSTGTSTTGSDASHVDGPMRKAGTAAFNFPVGDAGVWARIGISAPTVNSTFEAIYHFMDSPNCTTVTAHLQYVSHIEYWDLVRTAGTSNATITLFWENNTRSGITDGTSADLKVARWNGASWEDRGHVSDAGTTSLNGWVSSVVNTAFNMFTFGSISDPSTNPLPVDLKNLTLNCKNSNEVELEWETLSERENDYFFIDKSNDGIVFHLLNKIEGAGNSLNSIAYSSSDSSIDGLTYYRLSQVDNNGTIRILDTKSINCIAEKEDIFIAYTPNKLNITIYRKDKQEFTFLLIGSDGKLVYSENMVLNKGINQFQIPTNNSKPGMYYLKITSTNSIEQKKVIIN